MGLLDSIFGGGYGPRRDFGMSPLTMGLLGLLAYRTFQGKGRLADMLGRKPAEASKPREDAGMPQSSGGPGGLFGGLLSGGSGWWEFSAVA